MSLLGLPLTAARGGSSITLCVLAFAENLAKATRWLSWYGVGLANADRVPVGVRIPAGPLGSLKCDPPKGNGRRQKKNAENLAKGGKTFIR